MEHHSRTTTSKIALVHDFLLTFGGAERVLLELARLYPEAPIYTLLADEKIKKKYFPGRIVRVSWLQKMPRWLQKRYRLLLPLFPVATETLNLREYDIVLSSSGAWSKGIVTRLYTLHLAYVHSPMRYVWDAHEEYLHILKKKRNLFLRILLSYMRVWDYESAQRPECLLANSRYTQLRIEKYYRRKADIVYPPLAPIFFQASTVLLSDRKPYFLLVSRLTQAKRAALVIETFNKLGFELVVVGEGRERKRLEQKALPNIHFRGFVSDDELVTLYSEAQGLIFPAEEDFGLAAAEAHALGTPVIAYGQGGAREIIEEGVTGEFYGSQRSEILGEAILRFQKNKQRYNQTRMREKVGTWTTEAFERAIREQVRMLTKTIEA